MLQSIGSQRVRYNLATEQQQPSYSTPIYITKRNENMPTKKNICAKIFIASLFTNPRKEKQSKCPSSNEWIKKIWYIHKKKYSVMGRNEILMTCYNEKNTAEWKKTDTVYYMVPFSWNVYVRERLTGGFLHAVSHKSSVPYQSLATGTSGSASHP